MTTLSISGPLETVFDWQTQRCADEDVSDMPASAIIDASRQVQFMASNRHSRRMVGADLNNLKRDCSVVLESPGNADPSTWQDNLWIAALYTLDGKTIYAFVHNEYHGWEHPDQCSAPNTQAGHQQCWYASIQLYASTDGGASYQRVGYIASPPYPYQSGIGPLCAAMMTNVIRNSRDKLFYAMFESRHPYQSYPAGVGIMRTPNIADPTAWRAWDGAAFNGQFLDPYLTPRDVPIFAPIFPVGGFMPRSIRHHVASKQYLAVGTSRTGQGFGVFYCWSKDLLTWSTPQLLMAIDPMPGANAAGVSLWYPSLLDPTSVGKNFETVGASAWLYMTQFTAAGGMDRNLIRLPVALS